MSGRQGSGAKKPKIEEQVSNNGSESSNTERYGDVERRAVIAAKKVGRAVSADVTPLPVPPEEEAAGDVEMGGPVPGGTPPNDPPFFGATGTEKKKAFHLLRCKHTLADLVHDYGKPFLEATFGPDGSPIIQRILMAYPDIRGEASNLTTIFASYTTDSMAKKLFLKDLDEYCFKHEGISSFQGLHTKTYNIRQEDDEKSELGDLHNDLGSGFSWFLDAQCGNVIRDIERKKELGTPKNGFIKDLAYDLDPGSGLDASSYCDIIKDISGFNVPAEKSSLGLTGDVSGDANIILRWGERLPTLTIYPGTNSIESAKILIMIATNPEEKLDILFSKTAGDRFQGYSASTRWHGKPGKNEGRPVVLVTNDILASYDMAMYKKASVLLTGISELKLYQFGEGIVPTIPDPSGVLTSIRESNEIFNTHIQGLIASTKERIRDYFAYSVNLLSQQKLIKFQKREEDGPSSFNGYMYDISGLETRKMTAGMVFFLIDQVEKLYNYESMKIKMEEATTLFRDIPEASGGQYPIKYKPLLNDVEFGKYLGLTELYKPKISYQAIASAISALEFNFTKSTMYALYSGITMLLSNINNSTFPKNFVAFLITAILCDVTTPEGAGATRRAASIEASVAWRKEWLQTVLNKPEIARTVKALFEEPNLTFRAPQSTGGAGGESMITGFNVEYDPIQGMTRTSWPIINNILLRLVKSSFEDTTFADLDSYTGVESIDLSAVVGYVSDVTIPDIMNPFRPPAPIPEQFRPFVKKIKTSNQQKFANIKEKLQNRNVPPIRRDIPIYNPAPRGLKRESKRRPGQRGGGGEGGTNNGNVVMGEAPSIIISDIDDYTTDDRIQEFIEFPYDEIDLIYSFINDIVGNEKIPVESIDIEDIIDVLCSSIIIATLYDQTLETNPLMVLSAIGKFYENIYKNDKNINDEILELLDNFDVSNICDDYLYRIDDIIDVIDYVVLEQVTMKNDEGAAFMKAAPTKEPTLLSLDVEESHANVREELTQEIGDGSMTPDYSSYQYVTPPYSPSKANLLRKQPLESPSRRFGKTPELSSPIQTPTKMSDMKHSPGSPTRFFTLLFADGKGRMSLPSTLRKGIGSRLNERLALIRSGAASENENLGGGARTSRRRRRRQHTYKKRKNIAAKRRQTKRRHH